MLASFNYRNRNFQNPAISLQRQLIFFLTAYILVKVVGTDLLVPMFRIRILRVGALRSVAAWIKLVAKQHGTIRYDPVAVVLGRW